MTDMNDRIETLYKALTNAVGGRPTDQEIDTIDQLMQRIVSGLDSSHSRTDRRIAEAIKNGVNAPF